VVKPIIIGAGRGRRLEHLTDEIPKTMVPILGRPMLEAILTALTAGGFERSETVYICGYKGEVIRQAYPELIYVENEDWANNNILLALLCARLHLSEGFVSSYADIVYRPEAVVRLMDSPHDITLVCDTDWRRRYRDRSQHPENDGEKLRAEGDRIVELSRNIPADQATGEFIGVMRLTAAGAARFLAAFDQVAATHADQPVFRDGRSFQKAYLIDLLQHMIEAGESLHCLPIHGGYMEIDTTEDAACAESWWAG
jgi:choline kinase